MAKGFRVLKRVTDNALFWLNVDIFYDEKEIIVTGVEPDSPDSWIKLVEELDLSKIAMVHGFTMMDYFQTLVSWEDVTE